MLLLAWVVLTILYRLSDISWFHDAWWLGLPIAIIIVGLWRGMRWAFWVALLFSSVLTVVYTIDLVAMFVEFAVGIRTSVVSEETAKQERERPHILSFVVEDAEVVEEAISMAQRNLGNGCPRGRALTEIARHYLGAFVKEN